MATNTSVLSYGSLLQIGSGTFGAGTAQAWTITFGSTPAAGAVTLSFWGIPFTLTTASGLPLGPAVQTQLNALFAPTYANPFTVSLTTNTYTITAAGPFALMPLPNFVTVTNTSLQTVTNTIATPGVQTETFASVLGVETFPFPAPKADVETYVTYDTGNNRYKSKMKKFKDGGQVSLVLVMHNDATQNNITGLQSLFESASAFDWQVCVPTQVANPTQTTQGYRDSFVAFLTSYTTAGNTADARLKINATLDIDGAISRFPPIA
jgi:hypothetical protein